MGIDGNWYNEIGSRMVIRSNGNSISGSYSSAVGRAVDTYELAGKINSKPYLFGQAVGWSVAWINNESNAHSSTSWSGQYQLIDDQEEIVTLWLLTSETQSNDDWGATRVGKDVFTRREPSAGEIRQNLKRLARSHPIEIEQVT